MHDKCMCGIPQSTNLVGITDISLPNILVFFVRPAGPCNIWERGSKKDVAHIYFSLKSNTLRNTCIRYNVSLMHWKFECSPWRSYNAYISIALVNFDAPFGNLKK